MANSTSRRKRKSHIGKRAYPTIAEAMNAGPKDQQVYLCEFGDHFHHGHEPGSNKGKRE